LIQTETLELLEWPRLCQHLATFAATKLGAIAANHLPIPGNIEASRYLLQQTQEIGQLQENPNANWSFEGISDISEALARASVGATLTGLELLAIATTLAGVRRLRRVIDHQEGLPCLRELVAEVRTYPELEQAIHHAIDDSGKVTDRASPKLAAIRQQLKTLRDRIYQKLHAIVQTKSNALQEPVITQRSDRYVIPVKAPQKDQIPGIVHDSSSSGATLYVEPSSVVEWGNQLRQAQRQEKVEEDIILKALSTKIVEIQENLEHLLAVATALDLATAKAHYSFWLRGFPPQLVAADGTETLILRQLRHPLLIWQQQYEQGGPVVPINVQISPKIRVVAITGPNTGGKTVTLKTLGLAAVMAKVGLYIPAQDPVVIPWFGQVLADIGDEQSLEQNLSTFSGHIHRIIRIIQALNLDHPDVNALQGDLVLLDEVGAGTDPAEGSALAIALLHFFANTVRLTLATTHYGELKALKYQDDRFENASVEFDEESLSPTYRLLWGIPGRSNALTIASKLGLRSQIIDEARTRMGGRAEDINQVIAGLEAQRREQEEKAQEAQGLLQKTEQFYAEISAKAQSLQEREQALKRFQEQEVQSAIAQAKSEVAKVIRQLQQGTPTAQDAQQATAHLQAIAQQQLPPVEKKQANYLPHIGERIRLPSLGQTAEVLERNDDTQEVSVRFGLMKLSVPLKDIESLDGKKVTIPSKSPSKVPNANLKPDPKPNAKPSAPVMVRTESNTIDIRGKRIDEAESALEPAIAKATASGIVWIIHGKGTGRLRQGVHEFLQRHPQVDRYEIAAQQEGGLGVTVAYLR